MASRTYSQINDSITGSRKFRRLDHRARWAWLCAHLKADYAGIAEYPTTLWAFDAGLSSDEMNAAIMALVDVKLIEWCEDREVCRVTGFIKQRPPDNASAAHRLCMDLTDRLYDADSELEAMLLKAAAEFAVAAVGRSLRWEKDRAKFHQDIGHFLRGTAQDFGDQFLEAVETQLRGSGRPTRTEIEGLLPTLSLRRQATVPTPCTHPVDTRYVDETRRRQDPNKYKNEDLDGANPELREEVGEGIDAEPTEVLRRGENSNDVSQSRPSESLMRSALVVQMKDAV